MPNDPVTGEPRRPNHELVKWRMNHSRQDLPAAITVAQQIDAVKKQIAYLERMERTYRETGQHQKADNQLIKISNLEAQLEDLQKQARRSVNVDQEVE